MNSINEIRSTQDAPDHALRLSENGSVMFDPCVLDGRPYPWPTEPFLTAKLSRKIHNALWGIGYSSESLPAKLLGSLSSLAGRLAIVISTVALSEKAKDLKLEGFYFNPDLPLICVGATKRDEFSAQLNTKEKIKDFLAYLYQKLFLLMHGIFSFKTLKVSVNNNHIYTKEEKSKIFVVRRLRAIFENPSCLEDNEINECKAISSSFAKLCCQIAASEGVILNQKHNEGIEALIHFHLSQALTDYKSVKRFIGNRKFDFYAGSLSGYRPGLFALHSKLTGGMVYGTCHGVGTFTNSEPELSVLVNASVFKSPNIEIKNDVKSFLSELPEFLRDVKIENANMGSVFYGIKPMPSRPQRIKSIAVMGRPFIMRTSAFNSMSFAVYLELEKRICILLKKLGYQVVYKAHPESDWKYFESYFPPEINVEHRPFNKVVDSYDAVFYDFAVSTTLTDAMFEGLHVFLLSDGWHDRVYWNDRMKMALTERCNFIPSVIGADGFIDLDETALEKTFKNPKKFKLESVLNFLGDDSVQ